MQSLSRALTVLAELNREDRPYGVTEMAVTVGLHKSTVHRNPGPSARLVTSCVL